jgi:2-iminobutanoate/2-iminopropanoate deaminase
VASESSDRSHGFLIRSTPAALQSPDSRGGKPSYCHVVEDTRSGLIFTAGQTGADAQGRMVSDDVVGQFKEVLRHIDVILDDLQLSRAAIVKIVIFTTDENGWYSLGGLDLFRDYFAGHPPVATLIGVRALASPEYKIEMEAVLSRSAERTP